MGELSSNAKTAPRVFISYSHENPSHKSWVASLATDMRRKGVDVVLDQWDLPLGSDVTLFMERGIRESSRVLLVCTPTYCRKAQEGEGGVGYERLVVTAELASKIDTTKFVCVLREGKRDGSIPSFAATRLYVDFTDDASYEVSLDQLLRDIHNAPTIPKPELGPNPYLTDGDRAIWAVEPSPSTLSLEHVYARAVKLLEKADMSGWRRLVRSLKEEVDGSLISWRNSLKQIPAEQGPWFALLNQAISAAAPLIICALAATESEHPTLKNQRGLLDDLICIPQWNSGGYVVVVEVPNALAYVYHHALGALLVACSRHAEAVRLLTTDIISERGRENEPLWRTHHLMGWPRSLDGDCTVAWKFLSDLHKSQPWLQHFFSGEGDWVENIRAYCVLASTIEFSELVAREGENYGFDISPHLDVPPMFAIEPNGGSQLSRVIRKAIPDTEVVDLIARHYGARTELLRNLWSKWTIQWERWHVAAGRHFFGITSRVPPLPK